MSILYSQNSQAEYETLWIARIIIKNTKSWEKAKTLRKMLKK